MLLYLDVFSCQFAKEILRNHEMFMRVTSLLSAYGETMENKDHGKNLVHKLILEGRLAVVSI